MSRLRHRRHGGKLASDSAASDRKLGGGVSRGGHLRGEGEVPKERHDRKQRARGGGNWIAGAVSKPGALHRSLHVPEGQKIPAKKLAKAARSKNPTTRRRAALAETLKHFHH